MNNILANITALIILESRLSFEDSCALFKISKEELETIMKYCVSGTLERALKYLFYCESITPSVANPEKAKFKAALLYRKYINILKIEDESERKEKLHSFIYDITDRKMEYLKDKDRRKFTEEEKNFVFKYQIKYALTFKELELFYNFHSQIILKWKKELQNEHLKQCVKSLDEYNLSYFGNNNYKR